MIATMIHGSKAKAAPMPAVLTFFGPDAQSQIHAINQSSGQEVARFHVHEDKKDFTISRVGDGGSQTSICTGHTTHSLMTATSIRMNLHNQEIKIVQDEQLYATEGRWDLKVATGKLTWKEDGDDKKVLNLKDANKTLVAKADTRSARLDVFVLADPEFLDLIVCSCVAVLKHKGDLKQESLKTAKAVDAFASGVDAANALSAVGACSVM